MASLKFNFYLQNLTQSAIFVIRLSITINYNFPRNILRLFRLKFITSTKHKSTPLKWSALCLVEEDGFEPSKAEPTDLQSVPFGHSGTLP